jgi:phage/plasmid-associated DNA primase
VAQETERNGVLNNALWKELTGGDTLTARGLYEQPHDFIPTAQILVCTNHQPRFDAHDEATIERMVVIPFSIQHEKGGKGTLQQKTIYHRIMPEYPAIVKLFAEYYIRFKIEFEGVIPLSVESKNYKESYIKAQESDLGQFLDTNVDIDMSGNENAFEKVQDVYDQYLWYYDLKADDKEALTRNKFVRYIKYDWMEVKYKQKKINGKPELCFFNLKLRKREDVVKDDDTEKAIAAPQEPPDEAPF